MQRNQQQSHQMNITLALLRLKIFNHAFKFQLIILSPVSEDKSLTHMEQPHLIPTKVGVFLWTTVQDTFMSSTNLVFLLLRLFELNKTKKKLRLTMVWWWSHISLTVVPSRPMPLFATFVSMNNAFDTVELMLITKMELLNNPYNQCLTWHVSTFFMLLHIGPMVLMPPCGPWLSLMPHIFTTICPMNMDCAQLTCLLAVQFLGIV